LRGEERICESRYDPGRNQGLTLLERSDREKMEETSPCSAAAATVVAAGRRGACGGSGTGRMFLPSFSQIRTLPAASAPCFFRIVSTFDMILSSPLNQK